MLYPHTSEVDQKDIYHGVEIADPYRWLEDDRAPETAAWVKAQNELTFDYLGAIPYRDVYRARLTEIWNYPRESSPRKHGDRYFLFKNDGLQNQGVMYARTSHEDAGEIVLDPNLFSEDGTVALSTYAITDDGSMIAYGISRSGSDWNEVRVRDIGTGIDYEDVVHWVKFSLIYWTKDNKGFFYSRYPAPDERTAYSQPNQNHRLYYHRLGTDQSEDILIHERPDNPEWHMAGQMTEDGRYLVIYMNHAGPKSMLSYVDLGDPMNPQLDAPVTELVNAFEAAFELIGNDGPVLYLQTDLDAPRSRVVVVDLREPQRENWRTVIPESEDVLQSVTLARDSFICIYLHDAHSRLKIFDIAGTYVRDIPLPAPGSAMDMKGTRDSDEAFYYFTSFLYPTTIFRYDLATGTSELYHAPKLDFDQSLYETQQIWFTSKDGTRVPMFVTHRSDIKLDGSNPTILYGYGGFNTSLTPFFSIVNLLWLDQGGIFVIVNLRGGGEFGEEWHQGGTQERKQNVFDDFIAAAEHLIEKGFTSPGKLAIQGGSNGGLLVGAAMCQRPELFAVALPAVGVMDMLRYHHFTIGRAWAGDYGTSDNPDHFRVLHTYSPLHNLQAGTNYPATLVTTADHDDRVVPAHSFKFTAMLQKCQGGSKPCLIRVETKAGHGGGKPIAMLIEENADVMAFAMHNLRG